MAEPAEMIVVKIGGGTGIDLDAICADIAEIVRAGQPIMVVHGGAQATNALAEQLGHPPRFVTSVSGYVSRYTDRRTLEIFEMVYCGVQNKGIVERLQTRGVNALGLSGLDGRLLEGIRKATLKVVEPDGRRRVIHDDYTGTIVRVNTSLLTMLLSGGYVPVITPPAASTDGEAINVDGDRAAGMIAAALNATHLVILSDVPGLLRDVTDPASLVEHIPQAELQTYAAYAQGRFKKKIMGTGEALAGGVGRVVLGDGRSEAHPLLAALAGRGTVIS